jgi:hypothetical protein
LKRFGLPATIHSDTEAPGSEISLSSNRSPITFSTLAHCSSPRCTMKLRAGSPGFADAASAAASSGT